MATTQDRVTKVASIPGSDFVFIFASVKVEDIVMCENGTDAWAIGIGPGPFDDAMLFKITGVNTASPSVDPNSFIQFPDPYLDGTFPAGMGPRGFPGLAVSIDCTSAYFPNFFLDSVAKVDLGAGELVWPAEYTDDTVDQFRTIGAPVDVQLNSPADDTLYVSSADGALYVLNAASGSEVKMVETGGIGPGSVVAIGNSYAMVVQNSQDIACIDMSNDKVKTLGGLGTNPYMGLASNDGQLVYISNQGSNTVTAYAGLGCNKSPIATISVGNAPRHLALSPDNRYLYVSNSLDNTVSIIDTRSLSVVETLEVAGKGEPAPVGVVTVSKDNRYLYAFWEGGPKGTPGQFEIEVFDVSGLYKTP
jgi:YVTN family beta-propeller protein